MFLAVTLTVFLAPLARTISFTALRHKRLQFALEVTHAGLAGVAADDFRQTVIGELEFGLVAARDSRALSATGGGGRSRTFSSSV